MTRPVQSRFIPATGDRPGWSDSGWLVRYSIRGLWELVRARAAFTRFTAKRIVERNRAVRARAASTSAPRGSPDPRLLARISYVLPRLSDRLPWRSDCLIQSSAGQNWLIAHGFASEVRIGFEHPEGGAFGAHAWLVCDEVLVTGGEIGQYHTLLAEPGQNGD